MFPLNNKKRPAVPEGTDWRDWRGEVNTPLVGLLIPSGVIVLDVDSYKGVSLDDVERVLGCSLDWSAAELQLTQRGGRHYVFSVPAGDYINGTDIGGLAGFDTRASGKGYIATGEGYENLTFFDSVREALNTVSVWPPLPSAAVEVLRVKPVDSCDLMALVVSQPLDISEEDADDYLSRLPDSAAEDSGQWLRVMMAIHHQFGEAGWDKFDAFSRRCPDKYDARMNRRRWDSLGKSSGGSSVTFASVIELAGGKVGDFELLLQEARAVDDLATYERFRDKVQPLGLGPDLRAMLASELVRAFGRDCGLTKTEIKKALEKKRAVVSGAEWLAGWVYVEKLCEFANTELNYTIKREAFNAKHDRDCLEMEMQASHYALNMARIPTVVDCMYWPGADTFFDKDGCAMLNSYKASGIEPAKVADADVVALFMAHVALTLECETEQRILIDFLAYVYQNPGKRVNWAMLLQGAQGTGKSYFSNLMQYIMGENVRALEPAAIGGRFTGWAHGAQLIVVEEVRVSGTNKFEILDRMKPFITNETIQIEEKGRDHRTVPNFTSYFLLTNHKDSIPMVEGDRRYCVLFSRIQSEEQLFTHLGGKKGAEAYFDALFNGTRKGAAALARFFADWQISPDFNPKGRAPETSAKRLMQSLSVSPERSALEDAIALFHSETINDTTLDVTELNRLASVEGIELPHTRAMSAILLEMGYEPVPGRRRKVRGNYHYIWERGAIDPF